jgi:formylglycine-generating enzyme required for sulfatase activity
VTVDAFWIDRTPVTNRQFREFVKATGHVTFAEIAPDPKDYPGALPNNSVTAEIEVPESGAEGVIIAQGANIGAGASTPRTASSNTATTWRG